MSLVPNNERSFKEITKTDLQRLAKIEYQDRQDRFKKHPRWKELYSTRVLGVVLCQGAALHLLEGKVGINDFDVWTFYAEHPEAPYPPRWRLDHGFGDSKFGQSSDNLEYVGRRVDCIGRSISANPDEDLKTVICRYLTRPRTASAKFLAKKPVIILSPTDRMGEVIWHPEASF